MKGLKKFGIVASVALCMGSMPAYQLMAEEVSLIDVAEDISLRVIVDEVKQIEAAGTLGELTIQERMAGDLTYSHDPDERTLVLSLEGTDYSFENLPEVKLGQGFNGMKASVEYLSEKGAVTHKKVIITLPRKEDQFLKGQIVIDGLQVKTTAPVKNSTLELKIGRLEEQDYTAVKVAETLTYGAVLEPSKIRRIKAGDSAYVSFSLQEGMPDSLTSARKIEVAVDKGFFMADSQEKLLVESIYLNDRNITSKVEINPYYDEQNKLTSFSLVLPQMDDDARDAIRIEGLALYTGLEEKGEITMTVSGRDLEQPASGVIAEIEEGTQVETKKIETSYGVTKQTGGAIIIDEKDRRALELGIIKLSFEGAPYVTYTGQPEVEVTEGDVEIKTLGWSEEEDNVLELKVVKKSTRPSTIVIKDFTYSVSNICPSGGFDLILSGNSLAPEVEETKIEIKDFMTVTDKKAPIGGTIGGNGTSNAKRVTKFKLNSAAYEMNGVTYAMDAAAFSQQGRIMVPIRYVAVAAGIADQAVAYNKGEITVEGEEKITLYLGSKLISCGNESYLMTTEPVSINGRVYVPVAEIAKALGIQVKWEGATQTAVFTK